MKRNEAHTPSIECNDMPTMYLIKQVLSAITENKTIVSSGGPRTEHQIKAVTATLAKTGVRIRATISGKTLPTQENNYSIEILDKEE